VYRAVIYIVLLNGNKHSRCSSKTNLTAAKQYYTSQPTRNYAFGSEVLLPPESGGQLPHKNSNEFTK